MAYNLTALQAADTVGKLVVYADAQTGELLCSLVVIAFFFIMLSRLKRYTFEDSFAVSSFWSLFISLIGAYIGVVNYLLILLFAIFTFVGMFFVWQNSKKK